MPSKEVFSYIIHSLQAVYEEREAQNIAFLLIAFLYQMKKRDILLNREISDSQYNAKNLDAFIYRLQQHEPIQYVLGEAHFYGLDLLVTPEVLIPRPETEELVHLIIQENRHISSLNVLDIGTGSGCIPITLSKYLKNAQIHAIDISQEALAIAQKNAQANEAHIIFHQFDILSSDLEALPLFDIIVSNPPYIREIEKKYMQANVLRYEPIQALFVPDNQPLLFYERIAMLASKRLKKGGRLYFEINENFGKQVTDQLLSLHFKEVKTFKDLQGKDRIVRGNLSF
ncbi:release factor glutamine methyltransferase [Thermoflexibacter ruber]|uniref:Release factor glutamine methyltransferase n=2 Tax=Thermoflexibacter ruber TaxID=1003 RepID=A0A1I2C6W2_9BACT|nr:release factor glutamine methyltransferase [Thermoflexibacter ruber]